MRYKISDLAKLLDVSTNTVRRYEDMGYISAVRDENSGYSLLRHTRNAWMRWTGRLRI